MVTEKGSNNLSGPWKHYYIQLTLQRTKGQDSIQKDQRLPVFFGTYNLETSKSVLMNQVGCSSHQERNQQSVLIV